MFQKWFQLKCNNASRAALGIALLLLAVPSSANPGANPAIKVSKKTLPQLLSDVEAKYTKATTLTADFSQVTEDAVLVKKKKSSGRIFIKRPSKVRWETAQPDQNLLVSDGTKFWYYTPPFDTGERGQVIEKRTSDIQSRLANSLLSGAFSMNRDMAIQQKSPSSFVLTPKAGTAGTVLQATVEIDPIEKLIRKVTLNHRGGNRAEISLTQIQLGQTLEEDLFTFKTPPNTDILDELKK